MKSEIQGKHMRWVPLVSLLLFPPLARAQDPGEADRLVRELGDVRFEARERAAGRLKELGPRALEALRRARENPDAEVRARVAALLGPLEREVALQALIQKCQTEQRPARLRLVTMDAVDAPLESLLRDLSAQAGVRFDLKDIDPSRRTTVHAKETSFIRILDQLRLSYDRDAQLRHDSVRRDRRAQDADEDDARYDLKPENPPDGAAYTDGARFAFSLRPWAPKGQRFGYIFETHADQDFLGDLEWDVAAVRTDRELTFETCDVHSPQLVYVPDPDLTGARVTVRGTRRWYCDVPIEFDNPKDGESRHAGPYEIVVQWPNILVRSDRPRNEAIVKACLGSRDVQYRLKPGYEDPFMLMGLGEGGGGGGRYGGRFGVDLAWCGCAGQPSKGARTPPATARERSVEAGFAPTTHAIEEIASITVRFHLPVEEPFEVTSALLK